MKKKYTILISTFLGLLIFYLYSNYQSGVTKKSVVEGESYRKPSSITKVKPSVKTTKLKSSLNIQKRIPPTNMRITPSRHKRKVPVIGNLFSRRNNQAPLKLKGSTTIQGNLLLQEYYACPIKKCKNGSELFTIGDYLVYSTNTSAIYSSYSLPVFYNSNRNQFGVWNNTIVVEYFVAIDHSEKFKELKVKPITDIEMKNVDILQYSGEESKIDEVVGKIKSLKFVKNVNLEINFGKRGRF